MDDPYPNDLIIKVDTGSSSFCATDLKNNVDNGKVSWMGCDAVTFYNLNGDTSG